jgi:hypothetical protein
VTDCEEKVHLGILIDSNQTLIAPDIANFLEQLASMGNYAISFLSVPGVTSGQEEHGLLVRMISRAELFYLSKFRGFLGGESLLQGIPLDSLSFKFMNSSHNTCFDEISDNHILVNLTPYCPNLNFLSPVLTPEVLTRNFERISNFRQFNNSDFAVSVVTLKIGDSNKSLILEIANEKYQILNEIKLRNATLALTREVIINFSFQKQRFSELDRSNSKEFRKPLNALVYLKIFMGYFVESAVRKIERILLGEYVWSLAFARQDTPYIDYSTAGVINSSGADFIADPFIYIWNENIYIFFEKFNYGRGLGEIWCGRLTENGIIDNQVALVENFHLSFPYMFEYQGRLFMCPETSQLGEVRVYECESFPQLWKFHSTIFEKHSAVDSLLFEWESKWWLVTNVDITGTNEFTTFLNIYYADTPLSKDWMPHKLNPVVTSAAKARNGGGFIYKGERFRVAQVQGKNHYGKTYSINKLVRLDVEHFEEEKSTFEPNLSSPHIHGSHHLDYKNGIAITDLEIRGI